MPEAHFMRDDLIASLIGVGLFAFIALIPGYVLSWAANLLDFRSQAAGWRLVISVPVSIAAVPILVYWIDKLAGRTAIWAVFSVCWAAFAVLPVIRRAKLPGRTSLVFVVIALVWTALVLGSVMDLQIGDRLYASVTSADHSYRAPFTDTLTRTGISQPVNPFDYIDGPVPLRYHYFWFILPSLVDQLGGDAVPARQAFVASIVWCGIALGCLIAAYLRFFVRDGATNIRARVMKGLLLVAVTGLDIIPTFTLAAFHNVRYMDMEWWNEAVTSWFGSMLWAPHHVGGLISGLTAFLLLWHAASSNQPRQKWLSTAMAGIALASMLGDSIYVGLVMAVFLTLWTAITFFSGWRNHTPILLAAGVITVLLALPYLRSLTSQAAGGSFIHLTVRDFRGARAFGFPTEFTELWKTYLMRLVLLPLNYFVELGFFLVTGTLYAAKLISSKRWDPESAAGIAMVLISVGICTFLKSGVINNNDLGWRGFLPAQFMLLIWSVEFLPPAKEQFIGASRRVFAALSPVLPLLLVIGLVSTAYSLGVLRATEILNDAQDPDHPAGKRMYAARTVYEKLRTILPATAIVQQNPALENPIYYGLYWSHQTAVAEPGCGAIFGGSAESCHEIYPVVASIFETGARGEDVDGICARLSIDALIVTSGDPVWNVRNSWVWKRTPIVTTEFARAFLIMRVP